MEKAGCGGPGLCVSECVRGVSSLVLSVILMSGKENSGTLYTLHTHTHTLVHAHIPVGKTSFYLLDKEMAKDQSVPWP